MSEKIVIAIDGPAGSGKSALAKALSERLGYIYLDTGAMYRAVTFLSIKKNIFGDTAAVEDFIKEVDIRLINGNNKTKVLIDDEDVTDKIRSKEVNALVSDISKISAVREAMVEAQRNIAAENNIVAEGRDTTTIVFPDADIKVYLTASLEMRAERRFKEYRETKSDISIEEVKENIMQRDRIDSQREISPLKKADDAYEIDSTNLRIEEEVEKILERVNKLKQKSS